MINDKNKKILYIVDPPDWIYEFFEPLIPPVQDRLNRLLNNLKITAPSGEITKIKLDIDMSNPEDIRAYAQKSKESPYNYEIRIGAKFSYCLWTVSRTFSLPELNILPWLDECKIDDPRLENQTAGEILANLAFSVCLYCVVSHEISHIILGHIDYLNEAMKLEQLNELQDEKEKYSSEEIIIRKSFEAEADRQAGEFLMIFFEQILGIKDFGGYFIFPSRVRAYEFYTYAITTMFRMFQDLSERKGVIHPKPNERLHILIAVLSKYLIQNLPNERDEIYLHVLHSSIEASGKLLLVGSSDLLDVASNAYNLAFVDNVIKDKNFRKYQHKVELVG
jgi:hypothetical protein